jgi:hypothetical protein
MKHSQACVQHRPHISKCRGKHYRAPLLSAATNCFLNSIDASDATNLVPIPLGQAAQLIKKDSTGQE